MSQQTSKTKIFVGMSGGVDSSVSAALLQEQGFDVTGVFIKVWSPEWLPCDWKAERRDAMRVAAHLDIPFITLDLEKEYKQGVADYMIEEYRRGRTPNPDVMCNREVKFGSFLQYALQNGAEYVATGHYARNAESRGTDADERGNTRFSLLEGVDKNKDQSYFLWTLGQEQLKHILFPVGHLTKPEVRKLAEKFGLPTAQKKDSQGVCFLGPVDMREFLGHYITPKQGDVLDEKGKVIGFHDGATFFTLGQRHGFTITKKTPDDPKLFVVAKNIESNTIVVSPEKAGYNAHFAVSRISLENVNLIPNSSDIPARHRKSSGVAGGSLELEERLLARFRYRQEPVSGRLVIDEKNVQFSFDEPQSTVAPGQSLVLYKGEECLGGGVIASVYK